MNLPASVRSDVPAPRAGAGRRRPADPGLVEEFHRWPLPGYLWGALERRYHSIFCSEPQLRIHGGLTPDIEAWVSRRDGRICSVILFVRRAGVVRVINEVFDLPADELSDFAEAVFAQYRSVTAVLVQAAVLDGRPARYPCVSAAVSDDYVLALPASSEAWMSSLSAQSREKLRYHLRRTQRKQPGFRFRCVAAPHIDDIALRRVIDFNRARMQQKGRRFGMDAEEEALLCRMMHERGRLAMVEIDGELRAGLLCTRAGDDLYMHVIAHDPAFDDLRLGLLCCALAIQDAIAQGLRRFHFLWGRYDYKTRLGGQRALLSNVLLLRGMWAAPLHPRLLALQAMAAMRSWLRARRQH